MVLSLAAALALSFTSRARPLTRGVGGGVVLSFRRAAKNKGRMVCDPYTRIDDPPSPAAGPALSFIRRDRALGIIAD